MRHPTIPPRDPNASEEQEAERLRSIHEDPPRPPLCDLCPTGIPHLCPAAGGEFRVLLGGQLL